MRNRTCVLLSIVLLCVPTSHAQLFQDLFRGFELAATPTGGPLGFGVGGSQVTGSRLGRIRIVPQRFADGYRLEFDRSFGTDVIGRPEVYDFGNIELEVSGGISMTAGFSRRGIPNADLDFGIANLNYDFRGLTGAQDFSLRGTLNGFSDVSINPLGFYDVSVQLNNTNASLFLDGLAVDGDIDTDFDIGPVSIKGNLYFDMFVAALASFGVDVSDITGVFPESPIDRIVEEIQGSLAAEAAVLGETVLAESGDQLTASFRDPSGEFAFEFQATVVESVGPEQSGPIAIPEPTTALLLLGVGGLLIRRR